jgi:hypothetical protein
MVLWGDGEESSTKLSLDGSGVSDFVLGFLGLGLAYLGILGVHLSPLIWNVINFLEHQYHLCIRVFWFSQWRSTYTLLTLSYSQQICRFWRMVCRQEVFGM